MYEEDLQDERALRAELEEAQSKLEALEGDLHSIDGELEELSGERQQYQLLGEVCAGLEKLAELDATELFWGTRNADGSAEYHVREVRQRADNFQLRLGEIDSRRQGLLQQIELAREGTDYIAGDILEAQWLEEQRKLEWEVDREVGPAPARPSIMPWANEAEEEQRFRKSLLLSLLLTIALGVLIPMIDLPLPAPWEAVEVPERFTKLIKEEQPLPEPLPPVPQETRPDQSEEPTQDAPAEEKQAAPEPTPTAKPVAKPKGILAFREKFSGLTQKKAPSRLGAQAAIDRSGETATNRSQRSLVTTSAASSSGGISASDLSRDIGGGGGEIEGVEVTQATSSIGDLSGTERPLAGGGPGSSRTDEEIQIVFDRHKAALYRLYNRELRKNPTLQGQMVLRMTIEPDGSVSLCELSSSDMKAPRLSSQVVGRVKTFDFGAKDGIPAITILYPIDFLPAS